VKIEMGKKYTSNGKNLRIVCIDREDILGYKVVGIFDNGDIKCFRYNGDSALDSKYDLQEVWEPQVDEWCWFWDNEEPRIAVLAKFIRTFKSYLFQSNNYSTWDNCAKFDGTIPEHLRLLEDENINMKENTIEE
jgi:hypothetical protein